MLCAIRELELIPISRESKVKIWWMRGPERDAWRRQSRDLMGGKAVVGERREERESRDLCFREVGRVRRVLETRSL